MNGFWPGFSETAIQAFLAGNAPEPIADRPLNQEGIALSRAKIEAFLEQLSDLDPADYPCKPTYADFERERLAVFELLLAANQPQLAARLNDEVYGSLASMNSQSSISHLAAYLNQTTPAGRGTGEAITAVLSVWNGVPAELSIEPTFAKLTADRLALRPYVQEHFGFLDELMHRRPPDAAVSSAELAGLLDATIGHVLGNRRDGWKAVVAETAPNVFVNLHERTVTIPDGRRYSSEHARTLAVHEVGVHVLRASNGTASREPLAGVGLPGYGPTEEAFGVLLGNAAKTTYRQINSLIPFAVIEYASRPDTPSFRQVHQFALNLIVALANPDEAALQARRPEFARAAFSRTIRVLRLGRPGLIERSTTKYWRGQLLIGEYFDTFGTDEAAITQFLRGKYDCLNPSQLELITHHAAIS